MIIGFWNVNGLGKEKYTNKDFIQIVQKYDILCLTETWREDGKNDSASPPKGYKEVRHNRKNKNIKAKRNSGGISILYKTNLHGSVKIIDKKDENILWLKISKNDLGIQEDLLLGTAYASPKDSKVNKSQHATDTFEVLKTKLESFSEGQAILLGGDFNARLGNTADHVKDIVSNDPDEYTVNSTYYRRPDDDDTDMALRTRVNQDKKTNAQGNDLRDLCISTGLCVLNGRTIGDLTGKYTYIGPQGCSTVDYALASREFRNNILSSLTVDDLNIFSDHRPINVSLSTNKINKKEVEEEFTNLELRKKAPYFNESYPINLSSHNTNSILDSIKLKLESTTNTTTKNGTHLQKQIETLESLMIDSMNNQQQITQEEHTAQIERKLTQRGKMKKKTIWYNKNCSNLKSKLNKICRLVNKNPNDCELRHSFYKTRREYKKLTKSLKLEYERQNIEEMEKCAVTEVDKFWKLFKKIRNPEEKEELPNQMKLQRFFEGLYSQSADETMKSELLQPVKSKISERIEIKEIKEHVEKLKKKKAASGDRVTNEMLIFANDEVLTIVELIFNWIIETEEYPEKWNMSLTQLIYKDGDREDPGNYRGIALISNLSKLFNSIINTRLYTYIEENNLLRPEQGGFRKGYRTLDHIFTLLTLVTKEMTKGGKIHACFVDLKKAYDSVWREGLFYKLREIGIDKKTTNIIANMYKNTYTSLIYRKYLLPKILVTKGLKQGDNLSPILFNIYINDLPESISKGKTDPVDLMGQKINCLLWADDLIILSKTPEGLQNCVNNLTEYCKKWKLEMNMKKTKVMTFNKSGKIYKSIKIYANDTLLKNVNQYTYLGFTISSSGTLSHGINNLVDKAKRAWFTIRSLLYKSKCKQIGPYIKLYDTVVKPVMLYASEIWGAALKTDIDHASLSNDTWERFHMRVCRNILGVHKNTSNIAVLSELGRYPAANDIHIRMIRYFLRFESLSNDKLVTKAFKEQQRITGNEKLWLNRVKTYLDNIGKSDVHRNFDSTESDDIKKISKITSKREKDIFEQLVLQEIAAKMEKMEGKLVFFGQLKQKFGLEKYLSIQNEKNRKIITQIRLSAHKLQIELGRHQKVPKSERICLNCRSGEIESEYHFIAKCPNYKTERAEFQNNIAQIDYIYKNSSWNFILEHIFTENNPEVLSHLGRYLRTCWERREMMCSNLAQ